MDGNKTNRIVSYSSSFFLPIFILLLCFKANGIFPFGDNTVYASDLSGQYSSYLAYFQRVLQGENDLFYTFSKTLGGDFWGFGAYYLFSPFNVLLLLGTAETLPIIVEIIMLLKLGCCGLTMNCYLQHKEESWSTGVFAVSYSLMGYNMAYMYHVMWLDVVILFPIVMLGLEKFIQSEGKRSVLYVIALCFTLVFNYYIGFMVCVAVMIYVIVVLLISVDVKARGKLFLRFIEWSVIAGGCAAIVLVPTAISLVGGKAGFIHDFSWNRNWSITEFLQALLPLSFRTYANGIWNQPAPLIYCSTAIIAFVVLYFGNRKISPKEKIIKIVLLVLLMAISMFEGSNILWHAGNMPVGFPYRYSFIIAFFLIATGYQGRNIGDCRKKSFYGFGVLLGLMLIELSVNANAVIAEVKDGYQSLKTYQEKFGETDQILSQLQEEICRIEKIDEVRLNNTMLYGYAGLSHFSSTEKIVATKFMEKLGYTTYYDGVNWSGYTGNSTIVSDSFLALRYMIASENPGLPWNQCGDNLYENPYALQIGNVFDIDMRKVDMNENPFEIQNQLFGNHILQKLQVYETENTDSNQYSYRLKCVSKELAPVYLYLNMEERQGVKIYINGGEAISYKTNFQNGTLSLGQYAEEEISLRIETQQGYILNTEPVVYQLDMEAFADSIEYIRQNPVSIEKSGSSEINGIVQVNSVEDKLLVFSIPFDNGWTCWIDGERVSLEKVLDNLMAVCLKCGIHQVRLLYRPQGWYLGIGITIISILVAIMCWYKAARVRLRER